MSETDGVEEALQTGMRTGITAAARVGEALARIIQQHQHQAADQATARARDLAQRLEAEKLAARTAYQGIDDPQWWDTATAEDVAARYRTAVAWKDLDPEAARAEGHMATQIRDRYGVDVRTANTGALGTHLTDAADDLARKAVLDTAEGAALLAAADRADQRVDEAEETQEESAEGDRQPNDPAEASAERAEATDLGDQAEVAWDSAERREATARDLAGKVNDPQAVDAKMKSDVSQGRPAAEATDAGRRRTQARRQRSASLARQRLRQQGLTR